MIVDYIVLAQKTLNKKALYGHVSNGGGIISISDNIGISFVALNENFVELSIVHSGTGNTIKTQSWQKTKEVKPKETQVKFDMKDGGELF